MSLPDVKQFDPIFERCNTYSVIATQKRIYAYIMQSIHQRTDGKICMSESVIPKEVHTVFPLTLQNLIDD